MKILIQLILLTPLWLTGQSITQVVLINADTDQDITIISDSMVFDLKTVGTNLNIRADVSGSVGSVRFGLNENSNFQTESAVPYAMAGDNAGNYNSWTPQVGFYSLIVTPYEGSGASGISGTPLELVFEITDTTQGNNVVFPGDPGTGEVEVSGELKKWHKVTLSFDGPAYHELSLEANPFLDYKLVVTFNNGSKQYVIPGYFAADGMAGETSSDSGNIWKVHFAPDSIGEWNYVVSFKIGSSIAVNIDPNLGDPVTPLHGASGSFTISPSDKTGADFRGKGRLQYVGDRYLQFSDSKEYFLKGGADAPENLLAYDDIDNTPDNGGRRKSYELHANDWSLHDPEWQEGKGRELIGALNYLSAKGVNVISFLTMNIGGDDKNVYPYVFDNDFQRFDCSKLDQWEFIFEHADQLGIYLHFKTQETENDQLLDGGAVGTNRKLYYQQLIARFSHHLALNWNMGEENTQSESERKEMAEYFFDHDPYQHNRVIHTYPNQTTTIYTPLLGSASEYTGVSIQTNWSKVHAETKKWVNNSFDSGKNWIVANDEQGNANTGVPPDPGYPGYNGSNPDLHDIRKQVLWGNLMAGGAGVEYYFGYQQPESDLSLQDFRSRDQTWNYVDHALSFFKTLPFYDLSPQDEVVTNGWCLAKEGQLYIIYLPDGGTTELTLPDDSTYTMQWYDPRSGAYSEVVSLSGSTMQSIGPGPSSPNEDWAILISKVSDQTTPADVEINEDCITLFPNPTPGHFTITGCMQAYFIQIHNASGQIFQSIDAIGSHTIDINSLPSGLYFISIVNKSSGDLTFQKIVKQ